MYDCLVIGGGVVGSAVARELSRYKMKGILLEKDFDLCSGTSKANSGIVHSGYDATPGSLKAKFNVKGSLEMEQLSKDLGFNYKKSGSFVVCNKEEDFYKLEELFYKGKANGVPELELITDKSRIKTMEPNLVDDVYAVLYAPTAGIVCPFELNVALAENAAANGFEFQFDTKVEKIEKSDDYWVVYTNNGIFESKAVINCAGVYADEIHNMVSKNKINITPRKGQYYLLDRETENFVSRTIFPLPNEFGKGVLVTPTVDGNILVGPTAQDIKDKEGVDITSDGLEEIRFKSTMTAKNIPLNKVITTFAGIRAHEDGGDFIVGEIEDAKGFFDCAGIESPGLTSCDAIGIAIAEEIAEKLNFSKKEDFISTRRGITKVEHLTRDEFNELVKRDPAYGNIICRCETISEGQIVEACAGPLGARSVDGIKRRIRAGAGRCQGGFCRPKVMEIISRETGINIEDISKKGKGSEILMGTTK